MYNFVRHYKSLHPKTEVDYTFLVEEHVARSLNIGNMDVKVSVS